MASTNDITGDLIKSKVASDAYRENYDRIFANKKPSNGASEEQHCGIVDNTVVNSGISGSSGDSFQKK